MPLVYMCFINTSCSVCNKKHELSEAEGHFVRPDLGGWILKKRGHFQWHKSELMKLLHLISLDWHSLNKLPVLHCIEHWTFIPHHMSVIVCGPSTPGTRCFPIVLSKTPGWKRIGPFLSWRMLNQLMCPLSRNSKPSKSCPQLIAKM